MEAAMNGEDGGAEVVRLAGSVDLEHSPEVRKRLLTAVTAARAVLVDLSEVTYIDSSGIACLVEALQTARAGEGELGLVSVSMQAMRVLELARLDMVFPIHDDLAAARAADG
jgi:anti-sigma B factor antagonist